MKLFTTSLLVLLTGCGAADRGINEIGKIRHEIQETRRLAADFGRTAEQQSENWQGEVKKWREAKGALPAAIAEFLDGGITELDQMIAHRQIQFLRDAEKMVGRSLQDAQGVGVLFVDYMEAKMKANLDAIATALDEIETQREAGKDLNQKRLVQIMKSMVRTVPLEPRAGLAVPREIDFTWHTPDRKSGFRSRDAVIHVSGFGFQHPDAEKRLIARFQLDERTYEEVPTHSIQRNSDTLMTLKLDAFESIGGARGLEVLWKGEDDRRLCFIPFHWHRDPRLPPKTIVQATWTHDGSLQKVLLADSKSWDFGMKPTKLRLERENGGFSEPIPQDSSNLDVTTLGLERTDRGIEVTWDDAELKDRSRQVVLTIEHTDLAEPPAPTISELITKVKFYNTTYRQKDVEGYAKLWLMRGGRTIAFKDQWGRDQDFKEVKTYIASADKVSEDSVFRNRGADLPEDIMIKVEEPCRPGDKNVNWTAVVWAVIETQAKLSNGKVETRYYRAKKTEKIVFEDNIVRNAGQADRPHYEAVVSWEECTADAFGSTLPLFRLLGALR